MAFNNAFVIENGTITNSIVIDDESEYGPDFFGAIYIDQEDVTIGMELDDDGITWVFKQLLVSDDEIYNILNSIE